MYFNHQNISIIKWRKKKNNMQSSLTLGLAPWRVPLQLQLAAAMEIRIGCRLAGRRALVLLARCQCRVPAWACPRCRDSDGRCRVADGDAASETPDASRKAEASVWGFASWACATNWKAGCQTRTGFTPISSTSSNWASFCYEMAANSWNRSLV